ncbi:hypothetical protein LMG19282_04230 [Cupriavidus campinensis]|uniref:hypothetical protein n=1 Tax=Cupriavidus campinensis TaxID=151783 RepID=UPI001B153DB5|nr:hypothetical protein [Cupriavidus campinensis]CAG2152606.1 hypothetical protein LMG19282_04230 [Cupriavidus campinensis]
MEAQQALRAQRAWIDELLHRITTAESRGARLHLCAEAKREIDALQAMLKQVVPGTQQ